MSVLGLYSVNRLNFVQSKKQLLDMMLSFGDAGRELIDGVVFVLLSPDPYDAIYFFDPLNGEMSSVGLILFSAAVKLYNERFEQYKKDKLLLLAFLLSYLSSDSVATLETHPSYESLKGSVDVLGVWRLLVKSHITGYSGRFKHQQLTELVSFVQGSSSQTVYAQEFKRLMVSVVSSFSSSDPVHLGYISVDDLMKAFYINGLNKGYYSGPLDSYYAGVVAGEVSTLQSVMQSMLGYSMEKGGESAGSSAAFVPAALAASVSTVPVRTAAADRAAAAIARSVSLGPIQHGDCPWCFAKGYRNKVGNPKCLWNGQAGSCRFQSGPLGGVVSAGSSVSRKAFIAVDDVQSQSVDDVRSVDAAFIDSYEKAFGAYSAAVTARDTALSEDAKPRRGVDRIANVAAVDISGLRSVLPLCVALSAAVALTRYYWDNACSVNLTNRLEDLVDVFVLAEPFQIGGVGSGVAATHVGRLPFLPMPFSKCYYCPDSTHCLLSLGSIHELGGSYCTSGLHHLDVFGLDGVLIDHALRVCSNLYSVSECLLAGSCAVACPAIAQRLPHVTSSQRDGMDRAEALHQGIGAHVGDDQLCEDIANGLLPADCGVTPAMVRLNRKYRGPCPQCLEGKAKQRSMHPSVTGIKYPISGPGDVIYGDIHSQSVASVAGRYVSFRSTDGFSGFVDEHGADSKKTADIFRCIMHVVHVRYNKYGHLVRQIVCDSDPSLEAVVPMMAANGIIMSLVSPGQYCQRVEISIQSQDNKVAAVLAGIPFYLPPKYYVYARKWVADCQNGLSNSKSFPSSPRRLVCGTDRDFTGINFGDVVMVLQFGAKRRALSKVNGTIVDVEGKSELGLCMGYADDHPGSMLYLLENNEIVPRHAKSSVRVNIVPFGFKAKRVLRAHLSIPSPDPPFVGSQQSVQPVQAASFDVGDVSCPLVSAPLVPASFVPVSTVSPDLVPASAVSAPPLVSSFLSPVRPLLSHLAPVTPVRLMMSPEGVVPASSDSSSGSQSPPVVSSSSVVPLLPHVDPVVSVPAPVRRSSRLQGSSVPSSFSSFVASMSAVAVAFPASVRRPGSSEISSFSSFVAFMSAASVASLVPSVSSPPVRALRKSSRSPVPDKEGWITVGRSGPSPVVPCCPVVSACSAAVPLSPLLSTQLVSCRTGVRAVVVRRTVPSRPVADSLSSDEHVLLDALIADSVVALAAVQSETVPVREVDEFDVDDFLAFGADCAPLASGLLACPAVRVQSADLQPEVVVAGREQRLRDALRHHSYDKLVVSTAFELEKQMRIECLGRDIYEAAELPVGCSTVAANALYKEKLADDRFTCRITAAGQDKPVDLSLVSSTFTSSASDADKFFSLAYMQAYCKRTGEALILSDFDVVGGFLRVRRKSAVRLFLQFPSNFPVAEYAGKYVEVFGALYGLKESNRLFAEEMHHVLTAAGFRRAGTGTGLYFKRDPGGANPKSLCLVSVHVDDLRAASSSASLVASLHSALCVRFQEITYHEVSSQYAGVETVIHPVSGAILCTQNKYIRKVARSVGVAHMAADVVLPCDADFFAVSVSAADVVGADSSAYMSLTGCLVHALQTRDDVRDKVSHLCSRNSSPTEGDFAKAIHVLRYLFSTPDVGRVFDSVSTDVVGFSDSAFMVHPETGRSSGAFFFSVGPDNAPFYSVAKSQSTVATCPMTSEYMSASAACKFVPYIRQVLADIGCSVSGPTELFLDSRTAINLAVAPSITKKARHIENPHHYIRELVERCLVTVTHVPAALMRADVMTKFLSRVPFVRGRSSLLNLRAFYPE